jgi:hypothetical protein
LRETHAAAEKIAGSQLAKKQNPIMGLADDDRFADCVAAKTGAFNARKTVSEAPLA